MKKIIALLMALVCLSGRESLASNVKELQKKLQDAAKPILVGKKASVGKFDNILLRNPGEADDKALNNFLKTSFIKFIGPDDRQRLAYANKLVDHFRYLLQGIATVFGKLAIYSQRAEFSTPESSLSGSGAQEKLTTRKYGKLAARKTIAVIDPTKIPWGESGQGGAMIVSVDQATRASFANLRQIEGDVSNIREFIQANKPKCYMQPCKDRFDLLNTANELLGVLVNKINNAIEDLRVAESTVKSR